MKISKKKLVVVGAIGGGVILLLVLVVAFLFRHSPTTQPSKPVVKRDTLAPTVQLVVTAANLELAKKTRTLNVSVIARDNVAVVQIEYQLDGKVVSSTTKPPFSVALSISSLQVGDHKLLALAYDAAGNKGTSDSFVFRMSADQSVTPANPQSQSMVQKSTPSTPSTPPSTGGGSTPPSSGGGTTPPPQTPDCTLPNYPDQTCTGVPAGTSLTTVNGDMNITTPNTIIEGKEINGCIDVSAPNVIIRKSKVTCSGYAITNANHSGATNLLIEDTEISCNAIVGSGAITSHDYTARRVNVHDCNDVLWAEDNVLIEDSYVHHVTHYYPAEDNHTDGVQIPHNVSNITIRHNRIYGNYESSSSFGNSAITAQGGGDNNILIQDNLLAGGGYTLACYDVNSPTVNGPSTNFRVINNHFSTVFVATVGGFGPWVGCEDETQATGNVYHESGAPVPF